MAYVYVVKAKDTDLYKIGIASSADARLESLRTGSPVQLELLRSVHCDDPRWAERFLHDQLNPYRSHGEWFKLDDKQLEAVYHLLDIIADWKPKPNLVSLMVRYGFPPDHAIRQVYYANEPEMEQEDRQDFFKMESSYKAERAIQLFSAGASQSEIIKEVWGVTKPGRPSQTAAEEFQNVIREYMRQLGGN